MVPIPPVEYTVIAPSLPPLHETESTTTESITKPFGSERGIKVSITHPAALVI